MQVGEKLRKGKRCFRQGKRVVVPVDYQLKVSNAIGLPPVAFVSG